MIIYKTTNLLNGKIYIGQDTNNNPNYMGSGKIIRDAIKKYGKSSFTKEILEECETIEHLNEREIYWISLFNSTDNKIGYNILSGGLGSKGFKQSPEVIEKIRENSNSDSFKKIMASAEVSSKISEGQLKSERKKELHASVEYREKMSRSLKGRIITDEQRKKISESLKGRKKTDEHIKNLSASLKNSEKLKGENNPFYGMKHSEEAIDRIRESIKNKNNDNKK
jgi:group I intron endonuclease